MTECDRLRIYKTFAPLSPFPLPSPTTSSTFSDDVTGFSMRTPYSTRNHRKLILRETRSSPKDVGDSKRTVSSEKVRRHQKHADSERRRRRKISTAQAEQFELIKETLEEIPPWNKSHNIETDPSNLITKLKEFTELFRTTTVLAEKGELACKFYRAIVPPLISFYLQQCSLISPTSSKNPSNIPVPPTLLSMNIIVNGKTTEKELPIQYSRCEAPFASPKHNITRIPQVLSSAHNPPHPLLYAFLHPRHAVEK